MQSIATLPVLSGARPIIGHLPDMAGDRIAFMGRITREVDRVIRVRGLGRTPFLAVNHPESLQALLVEHAKDFDKTVALRFTLYPLAGEGLFTSRGELWRRQRRLMAPLFHPSRVTPFADDMVACTDRTIAEWRDGEEHRMLRETTRMTMSVVGKTLFHADTFGEADEIGRALTTALRFVADHSPSRLSLAHLLFARTMGQLARASGVAMFGRIGTRFERPVVVPGETGRRLREAIAFLDRTVQKMIDTRRASPPEHADLLTRLLEVRDEDDGQRMSDKQVRDEILTLFVAGHETTATALAWSIYLLCRHPEIYAAAEREVDALGHAPTAEDLPRLALVLRIFKEALRLYPPVYFDGREAAAPTTFEGIACPENTIIVYAPYALHRRPDLWPDPERFDPDRFLPAAEAQRSRYAWLPFGVGPRICIGMGFAIMEGQLLLARMLQRARFESLGEEQCETSATLRPANGVRVRIRLRE